MQTQAVLVSVKHSQCISAFQKVLRPTETISNKLNYELHALKNHELLKIFYGFSSILLHTVLSLFLLLDK